MDGAVIAVAARRGDGRAEGAVCGNIARVNVERVKCYRVVGPALIRPCNRNTGFLRRCRGAKCEIIDVDRCLRYRMHRLDNKARNEHD